MEAAYRLKNYNSLSNTNNLTFVLVIPMHIGKTNVLLLVKMSAMTNQ